MIPKGLLEHQVDMFFLPFLFLRLTLWFTTPNPLNLHSLSGTCFIILNNNSINLNINTLKSGHWYTTYNECKCMSGCLWSFGFTLFDLLWSVFPKSNLTPPPRDLLFCVYATAREHEHVKVTLQLRHKRRSRGNHNSETERTEKVQEIGR